MNKSDTVAHLVITMSVILIYFYTVFKGQPDTTIQTILNIIIGYWFGAMGLTTKKG